MTEMCPPKRVKSKLYDLLNRVIDGLNPTLWLEMKTLRDI